MQCVYFLIPAGQSASLKRCGLLGSGSTVNCGSRHSPAKAQAGLAFFPTRILSAYKAWVTIVSYIETC
jgi:hypothetical protein